MKINLKNIFQFLNIYYDKIITSTKYITYIEIKKNLFKLIFLIQNKMLSEDFIINVCENNLNW